ncbi:MAG: Clp protease N-terminal domain-containing protein [Caldilineaceae bacterium]
MSEQLDRFTKSARQALTTAKQEAQHSQHRFIDTEHVLLGLLLEEKGTAAKLLQTWGITLPIARARIEQLVAPGQEALHQKPTLAASTKRAIEFAVITAGEHGHPYIGTEHLLAGLLRGEQGIAYQVLSAFGVTLDQLVMAMRQMPARQAIKPPLASASSKAPIHPSPIFGGIVLVTVFAGYWAYQQPSESSPAVFLFVTGGWVVSLCLHEFSHALVAYWAGDHRVTHKGYLTLNPFKYTHWVLSILLPLFYMALGGIGLPGGAVYINRGAIPKRWQHSLVSAAGPLASALCALVLLMPFALVSVEQPTAHFTFWAGLAFLASLEVTAVIFNLLPIPGLDGFGIISPYLPVKFAALVRGFSAYTLLIIFLLFSNPSFNQAFWASVTLITSHFMTQSDLVSVGFWLFRFWENGH